MYPLKEIREVMSSACYILFDHKSCSIICSLLHIPVNVHMTSCPTLVSPGPKWYKLEAILNMTSAPVGTFLEPYWRSEAHLCKNKNVSN